MMRLPGLSLIVMSRRARDLTLLVILWVAVTAPFLGKAFHIDDTVHVLQAEHIARHPSRPLDLQIFWFEWPEWLKDSNPITPPVWQYELAGAVVLGGGARELLLNSLSALHLLLLALSVYVLATRFLDRPALALITAAFVLTGPAAVVGRNVMLDIPMLSYLAAGLTTAVIGFERRRDGLVVVGCLLVGVASVTKLPGIVGAPVLAGTLLVAGRWRKLLLVGSAFVPLLLWYMYQLAATGGVDILRPRGGGGFVPEHSFETRWQVARDHLAFWGGSTFTGHALLAAFAARHTVLWPAALLPLGVLLGVALGPVDLGEGAITLLQLGFLTGGGCLVVGAVMGTRRLWIAGGDRRVVATLLALWALGHLAFDIIGLWEMNVRFAFLSAVPATLLCFVEVEHLARRGGASPSGVVRAVAAALVLGVALSVLVAWTDTQWANGYRRVAREVAEENRARRVWFVGHWGFQHYATGHGFVAYSARDHELSTGDLLLVPLFAARQSIPDSVLERLTELERRSIIPTLPVRTMHYGGGFYSTGWGPLPWGWSREPAEIIVITRYN